MIMFWSFLFPHCLYFDQLPSFLQVCFGLGISSTVWWPLGTTHIEDGALKGQRVCADECLHCRDIWLGYSTGRPPAISMHRAFAQIESSRKHLPMSYLEIYTWPPKSSWWLEVDCSVTTSFNLPSSLRLCLGIPHSRVLQFTFSAE